MSKKISIMLFAFFGMFCLGSLLTMLPLLFGEGGTRPVLLAQTAIQNVVSFGGAALVTAVMCSGNSWQRMLCINRGINVTQTAAMILFFALAMPLLNQIIFWNENLHLPEFANAFEQTLREWEQTGAGTATVILADKSAGGLIVNLMIVGVLTGICEELFFRGTLQRVLQQSVLGRHGAVWTAAFVFSFMHFQFFGFIPRLLLGAFFGYLLLWSGSLWLSATAHAINNSIVVVFTWLSAIGYVSKDYENFGVMPEGFPWFALMSLAAVIFAIIPLRNIIMKYKNKSGNG